MIKSAYIHIPFCTTICSYCDFCKVFYNEKLVNQYLDALSKEIDKKYKKEVLETLYIGGGTPSSLNLSQLSKLFHILKKMRFQENAEITFECNIENIDGEKLRLLKKYGVNRLSIGVQTFHTKFLSYLNRNHTKEDVFEKIKLAKTIGFENINVDLMYGFDYEKIEDVENDLSTFLKLDVPHISVYSLILEPHTILSIQNKKGVLEDVEAKMYDKIKKTLKENNYIHYEISNFSKKGFESKHNLTYWNNERYYGFGVSACGYIENIRYENTKSIYHYINGKYCFLEEKITQKEQLQNEFILGFRKIKGISKEDFYQKYSFSIKENETIQKLLKEGKLKENNTHISIHPKYIYVMNEFLYEFLK